MTTIYDRLREAGVERPKREPKAPKIAKAKRTSPAKAGTKAPPVLPTGLPCAADGCENPALGDEYAPAPA